MSGKRLDGLNAVLTGGSRGIGAVTASALAGEGARVISLSRTRGEKRAGIDHIACDVTSPSSVAAAADTVLGILTTSPDILVNNAGIFLVAPLAQMDPGMFSETLNTNLFGPFLILNAFLAGMQKRGSGHVVTIGSIADRTGYPENGAYSAAKYGVRGMHEVLRAELRGSGVRSTLISPGAVDTTLWDPLLAGNDAADRFPAREGMLRAESVAAAVIFALTLPLAANVDELRISPA